MPVLVKKSGSKAIVVFEGRNCMNQTLTEDYLNCVIGVREAMFTSHRLLCGTGSSVMLARTQKIILKC